MHPSLGSRLGSRREFLKHATATAALAAGTPLVNSGARRKVRIGQIGTRHSHAEGKMATLRRLSDLYEVVGVVEPDLELQARAKRRDVYAGLRWMSEAELLDAPGLEAVVVETDIPELTPAGLRCLRAGKHIHLDKPPGEALEAYRELHREAVERRLVVQLGYMFRYNPAFQFVFGAVREGWLGDISEVSGQIGKFASPELRQELARFGGGGMFELGCHLVDATVTLLGKPVGVRSVNNRTSGEDTAADNQLAVLKYRRAIATIRCNHIDRLGFQRRELTVVGGNGMARINPLEPPELRLTLVAPAGGYDAGVHRIELPKIEGRYDLDFVHLARAIRGDAPLAWSAEHDLVVHETLLRLSEGRGSR